MIDVLTNHYQSKSANMDEEEEEPKWSKSQSVPPKKSSRSRKSHRVGPHVAPKNRNNNTVDAALLESLSPKSKQKMNEQRRSFMGLTKAQLTKECKKHKVAKSLSIQPDKMEMIDTLINSMFSPKKKKLSTPKKGKSTWKSTKQLGVSHHASADSHRYDEDIPLSLGGQAGDTLALLDTLVG